MLLSATGYKEFDASRIVHYGYGKLPNVITSFELEKMIRAGQDRDERGKDPEICGNNSLRRKPESGISYLLFKGMLYDCLKVCS